LTDLDQLLTEYCTNFAKQILFEVKICRKMDPITFLMVPIAGLKSNHGGRQWLICIR